jgi:hypothetical protein
LTEVEVLATLPMINMFVEDVAECFLNIQSQGIQAVLQKYPSIQYRDPSQDEVFLNDEQKKFIIAQIVTFEKKLKDAFNSIQAEKSKLEDELHNLYKNGADMSAEKKDRYNSLCQTYENIRYAGAVLKDYFNLEFSVTMGEEPVSDPTLKNFINNTTREYTKEQLVKFFDDEKEISLYLELIDPSQILESTASNVIIETTDEKKRMNSLTKWSIRTSWRV